MLNSDAYAYASQWGSFISSGDPGACMYGFDPSFRVQSETHREQCLSWVANCRESVVARPEWYDVDELERLDALRQKLIDAPVKAPEVTPKTILPVCFRAEKAGAHKGAITAVFPSIYEGGGLFLCYARVGQHSACSRGWFTGTRRALESEYADLLKELQAIYEDCELVVCLRPSWSTQRAKCAA